MFIAGSPPNTQDQTSRQLRYIRTRCRMIGELITSKVSYCTKHWYFYYLKRKMAKNTSVTLGEHFEQ